MKIKASSITSIKKYLLKEIVFTSDYFHPEFWLTNKTEDLSLFEVQIDSCYITMNDYLQNKERLDLFYKIAKKSTDNLVRIKNKNGTVSYVTENGKLFVNNESLPIQIVEMKKGKGFKVTSDFQVPSLLVKVAPNDRGYVEPYLLSENKMFCLDQQKIKSINDVLTILNYDYNYLTQIRSEFFSNSLLPYIECECNENIMKKYYKTGMEDCESEINRISQILTNKALEYYANNKNSEEKSLV